MTAAFYVPSNVIPPLLQKFAPLLKRKWFREFVLMPPTLSRRRFSNKTEDYGVFQPSQIARIGQVSIYVQDIERSRRWYEQLGGLHHSRHLDQLLPIPAIARKPRDLARSDGSDFAETPAPPSARSRHAEHFPQQNGQDRRQSPRSQTSRVR
jgi:hypothetical protein